MYNKSEREKIKSLTLKEKKIKRYYVKDSRGKDRHKLLLLFTVRINKTARTTVYRLMDKSIKFHTSLKTERQQSV